MSLIKLPVFSSTNVPSIQKLKLFHIQINFYNYVFFLNWKQKFLD